MRTFTSILAFTLVLVTSVAPVAAFARAPQGFRPGPTVDDLLSKYQDGRVRILIAAGHEPGYGGAVYQGTYEREITVDIANQLKADLEQNPNFKVIVTRDNDAWYAPLQSYFDRNMDSIQSFVDTQKKTMSRLLDKGTVQTVTEGDQIAHTTAATDVALRLYGINKWANENNIDLVVNLHVNDAADHGPDAPSAYTGYAVYVPDAAYGNSATSVALGQAIANRLNALSAPSTLPGESAGVIQDRDLIAIGANGTLNIPSALIEYGYITEPRFALPQYRQQLTRDLAYETYLAIQDFFNDPVKKPHAVEKLPTSDTQITPEPTVMSTTVAATTSSPVIAAPVATTTITSVPATAASSPVPAPVATTATAAVPPANGACLAFTKALARNIKGAEKDVMQLQRILAKDKTVYPEGIVNGSFGPATERAVQAFQKKSGIASKGTPSSTGYGAVGPKTAKALLALCTPQG